MGGGGGLGIRWRDLFGVGLKAPNFLKLKSIEACGYFPSRGTSLRSCKIRIITFWVIGWGTPTLAYYHVVRQLLYFEAAALPHGLRPIWIWGPFDTIFQGSRISRFFEGERRFHTR